MVKKRILNVGCGNETYGTHFVDLYPTRKEVKKCNVDSEKLPFKNEFFDEVYSAFLLEHLKNPGFALKEMVRVLKKGGKLIIKTDNAGFWLYHLCLPFKVCKQHYGGYESKGTEDKHYHLFTPEHLKNYVESLGLKVINIKYFENHHRKLSRKIYGKIYLLISWLLYSTKIFKRISYKHIILEATKE
ncbi:MAG: class I SAM-dependent methyltransferase [Candidatus Aenigmarchaeota archaeon]|nr:class I SAM-dependent methyltransferase [Candidatus Aenigmarchaeota archaeon]